MPDVFRTEIVNSLGRWLSLYDARGLIRSIKYGEREVLTTTDPTLLYSPYEYVEFRKSGPYLKKREGWMDPIVPDGYVQIILENIDGGEVEVRTFPDIGEIFLPRGIPVPVFVRVDHPLAPYRSIKIELSEDWAENGDFPGYVTPRRKIKDIREERSLEEQAIISAALEKIEAESLKKESDSE